MSVYAEKDELIPLNDVLRIGDSVARALDYAHAQGVIHRDVKPANVLVANSDGRVVLGDFGLALDLRDKSHGEVFGSPHYIAPEQARRSSDAVPQSDLYSLGIILYEMITGTAPFDDPSPTSLALQHITDEPPSPRSINPSISLQVEEVLLKALQKAPQDRFQSGKKLMGALHMALTASPLKTQSNEPSLPPIPVNAPAIRRSDISLNSFTRREDVITALEKRTSTLHPPDEGPAPAKRSGKKRFAWLSLLAVLLLVSFWGIINFRPGLIDQWFSPGAVPIIETIAHIRPATQRSSANALTLSSASTVTPALTLSATKTPTPTITRTSTSTQVPSNTPTLTPTVVTSTVTLTPPGYHMTAYYNENSFYILNKGRASRSVSGFAFERIDENGVIQQRFEGWAWEKFFKTISPNRCVSLEIHASPDSYLRPPECENKILSPLALHMDSGELFWISQEANGLFRVLWLGQEIARCEIEAGICDIYVP
jgi:serine/threonine protein kinase